MLKNTALEDTDKCLLYCSIFHLDLLVDSVSDDESSSLSFYKWHYNLLHKMPTECKRKVSVNRCQWNGRNLRLVIWSLQANKMFSEAEHYCDIPRRILKEDGNQQI